MQLDFEQITLYKLGIIETKLDDLSARLPTLETKVTKLESQRSWLLGVVAVLSLLASSVVTYLKAHLLA